MDCFALRARNDVTLRVCNDVAWRAYYSSLRGVSEANDVAIYNKETSWNQKATFISSKASAVQTDLEAVLLFSFQAARCAAFTATIRIPGK